MPEGADVRPVDASPNNVERTDLDVRLESLLREHPDPREGLFGPDSVVWKVARHTLVGLGGTGLGGVMDGAHPWIAQGVAEHSRLFSDPDKRFDMTYTLLNRLVFGDVDQVRTVSRALHGIHARVEGTLPDAAGRFPAGSTYRANEADALLWVYLVYFWLRYRLYRELVGDLSPSEWDRYAAEATRFGACFGIPAELLPTDLVGLTSAFDAMVASDRMASSPALATISEYLDTLLPAPARPGFHALALLIIPERLHPIVGLDRHRLAGVLRAPVRLALRLTARLLPASLRYQPAYHEAVERLGGRPAGRLTRRLNQRLVGRPSVLS